MWASTRENLSLGFANNKDADQPAHLRSLVSAFVFAVWKVSDLNMLQAKFQFSSLSLKLRRLLSECPKTGFVVWRSMYNTKVMIAWVPVVKIIILLEMTLWGRRKLGGKT